MNTIKAFMRKKAKEEEVVNVYAPESFIGDDGKKVVMKVKRLSTNRVNQIYEMYNKDVIARDENGQPIIRNNRIVKDFVQDPEGNLNRLIIEALVFPNLRDPELMEYYGCVDVMDMPHAVFASKEEYDYVRDVVVALASTLTGEASSYIIDEAKN